MTWTRQLADAAGWQAPATNGIAWPDVELALGTPVPDDYKEICETFGAGRFNDWLSIWLDVPKQLNFLRSLGADYITFVAKPFDLLSEGAGLIPWGCTEQGDAFFWLADHSSPDTWPTLVLTEASDWIRYDVTTSEFCYRILTEAGFGLNFSADSRFGRLVFRPSQNA